LHSMDEILHYCTQTGLTFWEYVEQVEGGQMWEYLGEVLRGMEAAIERGLQAEGVLPGGLGLGRRAWILHRKISLSNVTYHKDGFLSAYALAVAEENAIGGQVVTAPTCGSAGVLPAVLRHLRDTTGATQAQLLRALATAGLV